MSERIIMEILLPVPLTPLVAWLAGLEPLYGADVYMRQVGDRLQIYQKLPEPKPATWTGMDEDGA